MESYAPKIHRSLISSAIALGLLLSLFPRSASASNEWAALFTTPFGAQIVNTLDGRVVTAAPSATGATLSTVAGLSVGQAIVVDIETSPGVVSQALTQVTAIGDATLGPNWVAWSPALPAPAALNGLVRAALTNGTTASVFTFVYPY